MLTILLVSLGLAVVGLFPLVGLPGAVLLLPARPLVDLIFGAYAFDASLARLGPSSWGVAIVIALLWPLALPASFFTVRGCVGFDGWTTRFAVPFGALSLVLAILIATTIAALVVQQNRGSDDERLLAAIRADDLSYVKKSKLPPLIRSAEPLYEAISVNAEKVACWMVENTPGMPTFRPRGNLASYQYSETPLHFAATRSLRRLVEMLLARKIDVNLGDSTGATVAHAALGGPKDSADFVRFLAKHGADYRGADAKGATPLMHLAMFNAPMAWAVPWAKAMVAAGADKNAKDHDGKTAADYARETSKGELIEFLERR